MIELLEHTSSSYAPRTWHNAAQGVTLAFAADHTTAGERLTTKAASAKGIVHIDALSGAGELHKGAQRLYKKLRDDNCRVLNVAGNGIYTFAKYGWTQQLVNAMIQYVIETVHQHWRIDKVVSGGQTGADIAGLIVAERLGIPATGTWPKGYKMRFENGDDILHTPSQVRYILDRYLTIINGRD